LPGTRDSSRFVALGAHFDHLGVGAEGVYNGADDNASGVATVLAVARAFADDIAAERPTDRSVAFVFHGAEEKGLLGAEYVTSHLERSVFGAADRLVAHMNLDMVGREHPDSLYVVGAYRLSSRLGALVDSLNQHLGGSRPLFAFNRAYDDPDDPEKIFERSDHFAYAKQGIPIVFLTDGMGANWRKGSDEDDYHSPADDPDKLDYAKIARVSLLVYEIARHAAKASAQFPIDGMIPVETE
ncbi:MAG TPA: M28 family peptidase, partial [Rhodothermales bacterium]